MQSQVTSTASFATVDPSQKQGVQFSSRDSRMSGNRVAGAGVENRVEPIANRPTTRSMNNRMTNHVSVINHTNKSDEQGGSGSLLTLRGQIGNTKLTDIVFDSGAAVSCMSANLFNSLDRDTKSKLTRCSKEKQLTNATGGTMTLLGEVKIDLELEGPDQDKVSFTNLSVVIVNNLQSEMLLGMNALTRDKFKSFKVDIDNRHIVFEDQFENKKCVMYNSATAGVEAWKKRLIPVYLSTNTRFPPRSSVIIHAKRSYSTVELTIDAGENMVCFSGCADMFSEYVHIEDTLGPMPVVSGVNGDHHYDAVPVIVTNLGDKPYTMKEGTVIGTSEIIDRKDLRPANATAEDETILVNYLGSQSMMNKSESGITNVTQYDFASIEGVNDEKKSQLKTLLMDYAHVFEERLFGSEATGLMDHIIELTDVNVRPIKHYGYRVAPSVAAKLQENVNEMHRLGVIEESQSPWASPVLLVSKKDGSLRSVTDFRRLNRTV